MLPKKKSIAAVVAAATCASLLARGEAPTYVLGVPAAPTMYISSNAGDNEWLAANNAYAAMSIAATTGGVSRVVDVDSPQMELASAEAGFPIERSKPDYYLADVIEPPENVDWAATYANYIALPASERSNFIFDDDSCRLFAAKGGTVNFTWALSDGTSRLMTYIVSLSCSGRPRRIYWTDDPYNAPGIDLTGKFVKFLGNDELLTIRYGSVTNVTAGIPQVITNKIVSGVHLDPSTKMLYAYGQLQGQAVMAYYDTGTFDRLLHVQVIEVCRPQVNRMKGEIGRALKPDGRGYDVSGLRSPPTTGATGTTSTRDSTPTAPSTATSIRSAPRRTVRGTWKCTGWRRTRWRLTGRSSSTSTSATGPQTRRCSCAEATAEAARSTCRRTTRPR